MRDYTRVYKSSEEWNYFQEQIRLLGSQDSCKQLSIPFAQDMGL